MPTNTMIEQSKTCQEIKGRLRRRLGRQWEPGVRLPPIKDLARQLSTGQTNTHRAVKELVKEGFLASRPGRGTYVTDKVAAPSAWSASLAEGEALPAGAGLLANKSVNVLAWSRAPDNIFGVIMDRFSKTLREEGCRVKFGVMQYDRPLQASVTGDCDGLVVINPNYRQALTVSNGQSLCVISTSADLALPIDGGFDVIGIDSEQGGVIAGKHLNAVGCKRPCFIGCSPQVNTRSQFDLTSTMRLRGFEAGLGFEIEERHIIKRPFYMSAEGAKAVTAFLQLDPRPDAVFAASDELAIGFIHGALAHGLEAGRDYKIIGFDGQYQTRNMINGPLTSIAIPEGDISRVAAAMLTQRLLNPALPPRRVMLGCHLQQGITTQG